MTNTLEIASKVIGLRVVEELKSLTALEKKMVTFAIVNNLPGCQIRSRSVYVNRTDNPLLYEVRIHTKQSEKDYQCTVSVKTRILQTA